MDHEEDNSKTLRTEFVRNRESIVVNSEEVKDVEEFAYLGAIVEKKGGGSEDIRNRMQKARLWLGRRHTTGGLGGQCDGLMHLLAQRAMMMIMMTMIHTTLDS